MPAERRKRESLTPLKTEAVKPIAKEPDFTDAELSFFRAGDDGELPEDES